MTANEFALLCGEFCLEPSLVLEDQQVIAILRDMNDAAPDDKAQHVEALRQHVAASF